MSDYGLTSAAQNLLTQVKSFFGPGNVVVTSGARSVATNSTLAGSSKTSQHLTGNAFDFQVNGFTPDQVQALIAGSGIPFGQSIQEYGAAAGSGVNHLGVGTKEQLLTAHNGQYSTTNTNSLPSLASAATAQADGTIAAAFKSLAFKTGVALSAPGDALNKMVPGTMAANQDLPSLSPTDWFKQITIAILAILLIAIALIMLSGKSPAQIAGKVIPIVA